MLNKIRHGVYVAFSLVFAIVLCLLLLSCTSNSKAMVEELANSQLGEIQSKSPELVDKLASTLEHSEISAFGLDANMIASYLLDSFEYEQVSEVEEVNGTFTVKFDITCKQFSSIYAHASESLNLFNQNTELRYLSDEEINTKIGELILEAITTTDAQPCKTLSMTYEKINREFKLKAESREQFTQVLLGEQPSSDQPSSEQASSEN